MNWKRVISGVLAAVMLSALPVQLLVSAEGTEAVGQADDWEKLTTLEPLDESNTSFTARTTRRLRRSPTRKRMSKPQMASWTIWETARWRW